MKKWIAVMLVALMALSMIACGGKDTGVVGTWELDSGDGDEAKSYVAMMKLFGMDMSLTFNEDGTGSIDSKLGDETDSTPFTYTYADGVLTIDGAGDEGTIKVDGKKLTIEMDGYGLIFKKK